MEKFKVNTNDGKISSINRTIRLKPEYFEKIMELSEKTGVSFNKIVNQCIEYALNNMEEKKCRYQKRRCRSSVFFDVSIY